jgi:cysteine desulfurase/selenocysteine lyase
MTAIARESLPLDVARIRGDFPILDQQIHGDQPLTFLDNAASTQRPRQVIDAIAEMYERYYANVHRGIHYLSEESTDRYEQAREKVRAFLGAASAEEIIFTPGTTGSINLVARAWGDAHLQAGDEILLSVMEHHSNLVPWRQLAERTGAVIRYISISDDGLLQLDASGMLFTDKTKIVAITGVSNVLGTVSPLPEIIARAHAVGAIVLVDAAQQAPRMPIDVAELDVDFLALSGHKMLGPSGVGVLYGKRALLDATPPFLGGGSMINEVALDYFTPAELPAKFEAGTPPIVPAIGLGAAVDYLNQVGLPAIHQYEAQLVAHAHEVLSQVGGVTIYGPELAHKTGIVSFNLDGIHAHDVAQVVDRYGVAIRAGHHCTQPLHERLGVGASCRASFYLYNTPEEIDRLGMALGETRRVFRRK